jgi:hypothetical protein
MRSNYISWSAGAVGVFFLLFALHTESRAGNVAIQNARKNYYDFLILNRNSTAAERAEKAREYQEIRKRETSQMDLLFRSSVLKSYQARKSELLKGSDRKKVATPATPTPLLPAPAPSPSRKGAPSINTSRGAGRESVVLDGNQQPSVLDFTKSNETQQGEP